MDALLELGRGTLFRFAVAVAVLGLGRQALLSVWGLWQVRRRAGDKRLDLAQVAWRTVTTLNPFRYFLGERWLYSSLSVAFHVGLILVPLFYLGHVRLWERGIGLSWPGLPLAWADPLTLVTITAGVLLVVGRAAVRTSRQLSRPQDWLLPPLLVLEFLSGFLLAHPAGNPFALQLTMLVHVLVGDLLLFLMPFTKLAHCVLLPFSQLVNELAWRMVPGAGQEVARTLGKEGRPI